MSRQESFNDLVAEAIPALLELGLTECEAYLEAIESLLRATERTLDNDYRVALGKEIYAYLDVIDGLMYSRAVRSGQDYDSVVGQIKSEYGQKLAEMICDIDK